MSAAAPGVAPAPQLAAIRATRTALQRVALALGLLLLTTLGGCAGYSLEPGYLLQSVSGHLQLMRAARPVQDWLDDPATPARLKERLQLAQDIRNYASAALQLPDNASYRRYADLQRPAALWNVVAAPALSLAPQTWCFPVTGCVAYRGYYDEAQARSFAAGLQAQGLDVDVYPVPAYSTLGYLNWAGGDPLLNTLIGLPEAELARLIFHELAHQRVFIAGDTTFNESFASAVEQLGVQAWLALPAHAAWRAPAQAAEQRRAAVRALTQATRERLRTLYAGGGDPARQQQLKQAELAALRDGYQRLRVQWGDSGRTMAGWDALIARANNATLASMAAYDALVPAFVALHAAQGADWQRFYDAVRNIAALPAPQRLAALQAAGGH